MSDSEKEDILFLQIAVLVRLNKKKLNVKKRQSLLNKRKMALSTL